MLRILVVAVLVLLAFALRSRARLPETPEKAVSDLFSAASDGDDRAYLRLTTGQLRESLASTRSQAGAEAFRAELRRSAAGIKGMALTRADDAPSNFVAIDVELVFADRNERQRILCEPKQGGWAIAAIGQAQMVKPPIPYGTPVFKELQPEKSQNQPAEPPDERVE